MPRRDERTDERPDEGLIHAWLDGELGAEDAARVERLVAGDAEWGAAAAEARGLVAASTRIVGALDVVAGDVIPRGGSAAGTCAPTSDASSVPKTHVTRWAVPTWMRVAAAVALVAGVGYLGVEQTGDRSAPSEKLAAARETRSDVADAISRDAAEPIGKQAESGVAPSAPPATAPTAGVSTLGTPERGARQTAQTARNESDLSTRDARRDAPVAASSTASASAPDTALSVAPVPAIASVSPSAVGTLPSSSAAVTGATDVAGGIASGTSSRSAVETKEMLNAAVVATEREARAKTMQRALTPTPSAPVGRTLDSPNALSVQGARMTDRVAENAVARTNVSGCWHVQTAAKVDSIQASLRVVRSVGDTLVLALTPPGAEARAVRESEDQLRGIVRDRSGTLAAFRAVRTGCAP